MRICRFLHHSLLRPLYGLIEGSEVFPLADKHLFNLTEELERDTPLKLEEVSLLAPVTPSKIVCVGRNYQEHAAEFGNQMPVEPLLFLKAPSSIIGDGEAIKLPPESSQVEHEGELGVVIGREARRIPDEVDPLSFVLGYTCLNDVTARDLQRRDVQFTRAKSFDTFCPVGPYIMTGLDPLDLQVTTRLNKEIKQQGRTSNMAFDVPFLIRYISRMMTLYPGDLVATGTPAGVSKMSEGDTVEVEIERIGILKNIVRSLESEVWSQKTKAADL